MKTIIESLNIIWPYLMSFAKSVWSTVPTGVGTAIGAYFGTKHVVARLDNLVENKKKKNKRMKK